MTEPSPDGALPLAPEPQRRSIARTTLLVLPALLVFRAGELLLPLLLAFWFGRSSAMDVYVFAWAVFSFAGSMVFSAFKDSPLVPVLAEERLRRPAAVPRLLGTVLAHTWVVGGAVAVLVGLFALGWFRLRYAGAELRLALWMVLPFTLFLVVTATRTFFGALLSVERHFVVQTAASGVGMAVNIAVLWFLHGRYGVVLVPVAALAGELVVVAILAWFALGIVGLRLDLNLERPAVLKDVAKLIAHEVGGGAVTRVNPVVDQLMAGLSGIVGAGTMLRYSGDVAMVPTSLLQAALLSVLLSHLSDDFARRDLVKFRRTVMSSLLVVCTLLLAASVVFFLLRGPIMRGVFLHGEMDADGVDRMIRLMPYHLVGLAPFGALLVLARAHVALKNSGIMVGMGILNAGCNAVFNLVLLRVMGLEGIALATSFVQLAVAIVFWFQLEARLRVVRDLPAEPA
ncbi:MAG: putative peptidoglycan lipid flippase MurJ [Labilithrix sp.]|nr:putative peptidoglycan lipid flippase MurJ [Labilithrix sp.]